MNARLIEIQKMLAGVYFSAAGMLNAEEFKAENYSSSASDKSLAKKKEEIDKLAGICEANIAEFVLCKNEILKLTQELYQIESESKKQPRQDAEIAKVTSKAHTRIYTIVHQLRKLHEHQRRNFYILSALTDDTYAYEYNIVRDDTQRALHNCFFDAAQRAIGFKMQEGADAIDADADADDKSVQAKVIAPYFTLDDFISLQNALENFSASLHCKVSLAPRSLANSKLAAQGSLLPIALIDAKEDEVVQEKFAKKLLAQHLQLLTKKPELELDALQKQVHLDQGIAVLLEKHVEEIDKVIAELTTALSQEPPKLPSIHAYNLKSDGQVVAIGDEFTLSHVAALGEDLNLIIDADSDVGAFLRKRLQLGALGDTEQADNIVAVAITRASFIINSLLPADLRVDTTATIQDFQKKLKNLPADDAMKIVPTINALIGLLKSYRQQLAAKQKEFQALSEQQLKLVEQKVPGLVKHFQTLGQVFAAEKKKGSLTDDTYSADDFLEVGLKGVNADLRFENEYIVHTTLADNTLPQATKDQVLSQQNVNVVVPNAKGESLLASASKSSNLKFQQAVLRNAVGNIDVLAQSVQYQGRFEGIKEVQVPFNAIKQAIQGYAESVRRGTASGYTNYEAAFSFMSPTKPEHITLLHSYVGYLKKMTEADSVNDFEDTVGKLVTLAENARDNTDKDYRFVLKSWAGTIEQAAKALQAALKSPIVREQLEADFSSKPNPKIGIAQKK